MRALAFTCVLLATTLASAAGTPKGWRPLFDGKTLEGWKAPDMSYFSVEDGAITGTVTADHLPPRNQFIVWQGGTVGDFELRFKWRISGEGANSGMQFRGEVKEHGLVHGYQCDIAPGNPGLAGIWDEYGPRKGLAALGEKVVIAEDGTKKVTRFGDAAAMLAAIDVSRWNEFHIVARGDHMVIRLNGKVTAELTDRERGKARRRGVLAMPVIPWPMKVQYKDLELRELGGR